MCEKIADYSAGIISECSWFLEFKKIVFLKRDGLSNEEIKKMCINDNIFGMVTENRVKSIYGYLNRRINTFDKQQIDIFCSLDLSNQKIMNLLSVLRKDKLFFEFINEVYREKCIIGFQTVDLSDLNTFLRNKAVESDILSKWTDLTLKRIRSTYLNFMADANLIRKEKRKYIITPPILDDTLERYLIENGEQYMLKAITGRQ